MARHAGQDGAGALAHGALSSGAATGSLSASSGNRAFDDYRAETLKRLEDEQREFKDFLDQLRFAKDRSEFDQFMADRRRRTPSPANRLRRRRNLCTAEAPGAAP